MARRQSTDRRMVYWSILLYGELLRQVRRELALENHHGRCVGGHELENKVGEDGAAGATGDGGSAEVERAQECGGD